MHLIRAFIARLGRDRKGATAVEYGLVVTLITIAVVASIRSVGGVNKNLYDRIENTYRTAAGQ